MKKVALCIVLLAAICMFGGCLKEVPLTDAELDVVAEYAAGLLLNHDSHYESSYFPETKLVPTQEPTPTVTALPTTVPTGTEGKPTGSVTPEPPTPTPLPDNSAETNAQLTKVIDMTDVEAEYDGYELYKSYISNSYFTLDAKEGKRYLVVSLQLHNRSEEPKELYLAEKQLKCALYLNAEKKMLRPSFTLTPNDLQFFGTREAPVVLEPDETKEAVLVFEVDEKEPIDSAYLTIMNSTEETVFIKLE